MNECLSTPDLFAYSEIRKAVLHALTETFTGICRWEKWAVASVASSTRGLFV